MKLVVGLGNLGEKYKNTRHNIGFMVLDKIQNINLDGFKMTPFRLENQYKARITQTRGVGEKRVIFAKPQTFMNASGEAVRRIKNYYKIEDEDIIIVCDDLNLSLEKIRIRFRGSHGGHNGLKSIIGTIGENFWRIRIGIGSNKSVVSSQQLVVGNYNKPAEDYVLEKFTDKEQKIVNKVIDKMASYILKSISEGLKEETIKV